MILFAFDIFLTSLTQSRFFSDTINIFQLNAPTKFCFVFAELVVFSSCMLSTVFAAFVRHGVTGLSNCNSSRVSGKIRRSRLCMFEKNGVLGKCPNHWAEICFF